MLAGRARILLKPSSVASRPPSCLSMVGRASSKSSFLLLTLSVLAGAANSMRPVPCWGAPEMVGEAAVGATTDSCECRGIPGTTHVNAGGCPTEIDEFCQLSFDDDTHRRWYRRFWTGSCEGLGFLDFCHQGKSGSGSDSDAYWRDTIARVLVDLPESSQARVRCKLWRLGRVVGREWARKNSIRRIDTRDIASWGRLLRGITAGRVDAVVDSLGAVAAERLRQ